MLGSLILYLKGMGIMMFQLSGFWDRQAFRPPTLHLLNFNPTARGEGISGFTNPAKCKGVVEGLRLQGRGLRGLGWD